MDTNTNEWQEVAKTKPPLHNQVLVELKEGVGTVCDVATYLGKVVEDGMTVERWMLADVRLESRQIKRWAHIYPKPPANEIARAVRDATQPLVAALELALPWLSAPLDGRDRSASGMAYRAVVAAITKATLTTPPT